MDAREAPEARTGVSIYKAVPSTDLTEDRRTVKIKTRMEGAPYMMSEKDFDQSNAAWAESRGMNSRREKGLHISDAAVKRKTGISRTDLSSMAAYTVPPRG